MIAGLHPFKEPVFPLSSLQIPGPYFWFHFFVERAKANAFGYQGIFSFVTKCIAC
jgi:hypothetical protein